MDTRPRSIDEVATAFARIEAPFHSIPGNHDCDAQSGSSTPEENRVWEGHILDRVDILLPRLRALWG